MTIFRLGETVSWTEDATLYAAWIAIPEAQVWKVWTGGEDERFTHDDMNRIEANLNVLAGILEIIHGGSLTVSYIAVDRASQFRYDEALKLEEQIGEFSELVGLDADIERLWSVGRSVSYKDFERWESQGHAVYLALGGTEARIPAS